jgi:sugar (pentulose or hexulose) kinase
MSKLLLGIDEGTSAVKAVVYDLDLHPLAESRREKPLSHPRPGWVEQDPELVLDAVVGAVASVLSEVDGAPPPASITRASRCWPGTLKLANR